MANRHVITLSKSDAVISAWKNKTIQQNVSDASALVKKAIVEFIETGNFIDIGHIHFDPENPVDAKKNDTIILLTSRTPIINQWIDANTKAGLSKGEPIKFLLKQCIKVVPDNEQEYFPKLDNGLSNRSILEVMRANAQKVSGQIHDISVTDNRSIPHVEAKKEVSVVNTPSVVSKVKDTPQNAVIAGMDSLLPKRSR